MSRAERLLDLIQNLRRRRYAVSGGVLAKELGVSLRTLYRDIASLQAQGAPIEGEAGVGFVLRPGFTLPPLMFGAEEIEALVLGSRWVIERGDETLAKAARDALAKIGAVLPAPLKEVLETGTLIVPSQDRVPVDGKLMECVRRSIREETKISLRYRDATDELTQRIVWPFAIGFFDQVLMIVAYCELRKDFRHFRADRVESWEDLRIAYHRNHLELLREWRESRGIPPGKLDGDP
ncbi:MAG TPA: YafY family protein [Rectinemataceae bacterium]|nr:YafY family protein [Rectinemataceae bacterium]